MAIYYFLPNTFKIPDAIRNEGQVQAFAIHIDQTSFAPSEHSSLAWLDGLIIEMMHVSDGFWSNFSIFICARFEHYAPRSYSLALLLVSSNSIRAFETFSLRSSPSIFAEVMASLIL
jgi:hypothetical protein